MQQSNSNNVNAENGNQKCVMDVYIGDLEVKHEVHEPTEKMKTENHDENHVCCFEDDSLDGLSQRSAAQNSVIRIFCCQCGILLMMVNLWIFHKCIL